MKKCPMCGAVSSDSQMICPKCGANITDVPIIRQANPSQQQFISEQYRQEPQRQEYPRHTQPQPQSQPQPQYEPSNQLQAPQFIQGAPSNLPFAPIVIEKKPFTWFDVWTVMGFVSSIVGVFWSSVMLLPLGFVTSIIGFKGNRTKAIAVAGVVIAIIAGLIKLGNVLTSQNLLPDWFIQGIF